MVNIAGIDLNLLVALDALLREANVTRAARAIGLSQPAMSNALGRLRKVLGDPLFVRTQSGMQPTPRAEALRTPLANVLRQIQENVLSPKTFDPAQARMTFNIASQDYEQLVLLPALVERLAQEAPQVRLHVTIPTERLPAEDLNLGRIDLMMGVTSDVHGGLYKASVLEEEFVCLMRHDHPMKSTKLTMAKYLELEHLLISPYGGMTGIVDSELAKQGLARRVHLAVPTFAVAPFILLRTDYILTIPARAARHFADLLPLTILKPPLALPGFTDHMYWHERTHADPAHQWLRKVVRDIVRTRTM